MVAIIAQVSALGQGASTTPRAAPDVRQVSAVAKVRALHDKRQRLEVTLSFRNELKLPILVPLYDSAPNAEICFAHLQQKIGSSWIDVKAVPGMVLGGRLGVPSAYVLPGKEYENRATFTTDILVLNRKRKTRVVIDGLVSLNPESPMVIRERADLLIVSQPFMLPE